MRDGVSAHGITHPWNDARLEDPGLVRERLYFFEECTCLFTPSVRQCQLGVDVPEPE